MAKKRILIVDDDASMMLRFCRRLEEELQAEYATAGSVEEGLTQIRSSHWDAAVFDLLLPLGAVPRKIGSSAELDVFLHDGAAILLAAAFQENHPGRPMVIWSSAPRPDGLAVFIDAGVCKFFSKFAFDVGPWSEMIDFLGHPPRSKAALKQFWESVVIQPGVAGVKIDIKKLIEGLGRSPRRR
jgi:CheY-like chemotaxis protein